MKTETKTTSAAIKWAACLALGVLITGCAGLAASSFDKSNTVGRDVDEVIREAQEKGLTCIKRKDKEVFTNRTIGAVACSIKEASPICPDSYLISMGYELDTKKVNSFGRSKRTNCF